MRLITWIKENYILVTLLFVGSVLRLYHADFQSIWLDEVYTMIDSNPKLTLKQFYDGILYLEFIPHLYYFILRNLFMIFGYTTGVGRVFSAVIGIAGIYAIYLLARELFNKRAGLIAAAFLTVNIFHISYSQEMRPYGMLFLFTALAFYRLSIFIKKPTVKNAVLYGLFAGLIINSHYFGFLTLFAQYLIILFFLIQTPKESRKTFFINAFISGVVLFMVFLPTLDGLMKVNGITSFWLQKPGPDALTIMFREFFGNSEMLMFLIQFLVLFYVLNLFKHSIDNYNTATVINNKMIFSFIIIAVWLLISILIPLIRSYLSVPMILSRYFINIVPALILVLAFGTELIRSKIVKITIVAAFVIFSLIDLFVIKDYYHTITKAQLREVTTEITKRNTENAKIVTYWSWILPYFFQENTLVKMEPNSVPLEDYVAGMKSGATAQKAFWYVDFNSRPLTLSEDSKAYLAEHFNLKESLNYFDAWANYYVPKVQVASSDNSTFNLAMFTPAKFDGDGNMTLYENTIAKTDFFVLPKGNYDLIVKGNSTPKKPINGENAHIKIKLNGVEIADFNLSENTDTPEKTLPFTYNKDEKVRLQLIYDNDVFENGQDRNAIIYAIELKKK